MDAIVHEVVLLTPSNKVTLKQRLKKGRKQFMLISEGHEFQVDRTGYAKALEWQLAWYMQRTPKRLAGAG